MDPKIGLEVHFSFKREGRNIPAHYVASGVNWCPVSDEDHPWARDIHEVLIFHADYYTGEIINWIEVYGAVGTTDVYRVISDFLAWETRPVGTEEKAN